MPDVGILNLQIHDDSAKAAEGLSKLVAKLGEMKDATSKIRLGTVAAGIKRINDELSKVQPSAIYKLKQLADVLEKIGSISGNVGGIRISFGGRGQSIEDIATQMQAARDAVAQTTAGFEQIGQRVQEDVQGAEAFANTKGRVNEIVQQTGWTAHTTAEQFAQMFKLMNSIRMSGALGGGASPFALGDGTGGSGADWTYWKDGAIEVEGTVTDAMDAIRIGAGEAIPLLTGVVDATAEIASSVQEMAEESETFANTASEFDSVAQSVQQTTEALQEYNEAIEFARRWNASGASAGGYKGQESADIEYVNSLIESASQADLLAMRIDALRDKLYQMAGSGKATGDQIARMVSQIQGLQEKLDKLNFTTEDVKKSFSEIMAESGGLNGAFKRMFPTISGLLTRFKQIVKYRMLRAVLRHITEGFSEGVQNVYQYSKAVGTSLAPAMDAGATALQQMKNSIGAAVAPVIQALVPVLQNVVNWFINLINYANQFFALMNGQNTWTRALPESAEAYEKTAKNAKAASKATKDLLADWDELNIIQSNSGGGTGSGTGKTAKEYSQMFEEVSEFNQSVKDAVAFIDEHLGGIPGVLRKAGAILLGWKLTKAFSNALDTLKSLAVLGGITLSIVGIELAEEAGYDIGYNGLNKTNLAKAIGGIAATSFGGALLGWSVGGPGGAIVGFTFGAVIGLSILDINIGRGRLDSLYGDVHKDVDEIRKELENANLFTTKADIDIDVLHAHIKSIEDAEGKVTEALNDLNKTYPVGVEINPGNAEDFKTKINTLVTETNALINASKETMQDLYVPATPFFTSTFVEDAWSSVSGYVTKLGQLIGEELSSEITNNTNLDQLRKDLEEISTVVLTAGKKSEFTGHVAALGAGTRSNTALGKYDKDTVATYMHEFNSYAQERYGEALGRAETEYQLVSEQVAALSATVDAEYKARLRGEGRVTDAEFEKMKEELLIAQQELWSWNDGKRVAERAQEIFKEWTGAGYDLYKNDIWGTLAWVMQNNKNKDMRASAMAQATYGKGEATDKWVDDYLAKNQDWLVGVIAKETGMTSADINSYLSHTGLDPLAFFDEDFVKEYRNRIVDWLGKSNLTEAQSKRVLASIGIDDENVLKRVKEQQEIIAKDVRPWWDLFGVSFIQPTEEELKEMQRNHEKYKAPWEFTPPKEEPVKVEAELVIDKEQFFKSVEDLMDDGRLSWAERISLEYQYGKDAVQKMLDEYYNLDEEGYDRGTVRPLATIASAGVSDVGFAPYSSYEPAGSEPFSSGFDLEAEVEDHETPEEKQANIRLGTNGLLEALNSILTVAQAINRKEFTVNITPNSAFGNLGAKSAEAYGRITG